MTSVSLWINNRGYKRPALRMVPPYYGLFVHHKPRLWQSNAHIVSILTVPKVWYWAQVYESPLGSRDGEGCWALPFKGVTEHACIYYNDRHRSKFPPSLAILFLSPGCMLQQKSFVYCCPLVSVTIPSKTSPSTRNIGFAPSWCGCHLWSASAFLSGSLFLTASHVCA